MKIISLIHLVEAHKLAKQCVLVHAGQNISKLKLSSPPPHTHKLKHHTTMLYVLAFLTGFSIHAAITAIIAHNEAKILKEAKRKVDDMMDEMNRAERQVFGTTIDTMMKYRDN